MNRKKKKTIEKRDYYKKTIIEGMVKLSEEKRSTDSFKRKVNIFIRLLQDKRPCDATIIGDAALMLSRDITKLIKKRNNP